MLTERKHQLESIEGMNKFLFKFKIFPPSLLICAWLLVVNAPLPGLPALSESTSKLIFREYYLKESPPEPGRYIKSELTHGDFQFINETTDTWPLNRELTKRMYTLQAEFFLAGELESTDMALFTGPSTYPYDIYLNGEFLARQGEHKENYASSVYKSLVLLIPPRLLKPGDVNRLTIQCFAEIENTPISGIFIAPAPEASRYAFFRNLWNITGTQGIVFSCLILAVYFFFLFATGKLAEKKHLYFALLCFFFGLSYTNMAIYFDFVDVLLLDKISRLGFPMSTGWLCLFSISFTGILDRRRYLKAGLLIPCIITALITVLARDKWELHRFFTGFTTSFLILPYLLFTITIFVISVIKYKNRQAVYVLIGLGVILLTSLRDTYFINSGQTPYFWSVPYGYTFLLISIFFILAKKQAETHIQLIDREGRLKQQNSEMATLMGNLTTASAGLMNSYNQLSDIVGTAIHVITDYEESNNSIMAGAISRFNDLENIINRIKNMIDNSSQRIPAALGKQNTVIDRIKSIIKEINNHLESTLLSSLETNQVAGNLARIASDSSSVVQQSQAFIARISDYAQFINSILQAINELTGKTNILSINAAIEAARVGKDVPGFALVAREVSNLAQESYASLSTSFEKIKELEEVAGKNRQITDKVKVNLQEIIEQARLSANNIYHITGMIQTQQKKSSSILATLEHFLSEIAAIKKISDEVQQENKQDQFTLGELKQSFFSITGQLKEQIQRGAELQGALEDIKQVMDENMQTVLLLKVSDGQSSA